MLHNTSPRTLLIELGTEELPPKSLRLLDTSFKEGIKSQLEQLGLSFGKISSYGAPRRLAVRVEQCQRTQADKKVEKRGPAVSAAFDAEGKASKAALGWAHANGIDLSQAERLVTDKGEWLLHIANVPGQALEQLIETVINNALKQLPIAKAMRWGAYDVEFIRPVHTLCVMYGTEVLPANILGVKSSNQISGHRFHGAHRFTLNDADSYEQQMQEQYVIPAYEQRMQAIESQLIAQAKALDLTASYDQNLLEEISSLVEWPVVLQAKFEVRFLQVPKEALIYTMKDDQKYVPLLKRNGELSEVFLFVSNIESKDTSQVILGNEKVIRPRLSDAEFFFETDKKTSLSEKAELLNTIVFQKDLGSIADRSKRIARITQIIGKMINASPDVLKDAERAALLAKADLVSNMVMEFPSVQGTMGRYYALHDGENQTVATAIEEQYLPRFANDGLPSSQAGMILALADKLDTLVGIFGVNLIPKGDKDPFALRRSAIGILRMLVQFDLDIAVKKLIQEVSEEFGSLLKNENTAVQVTTFLFDRCKAYYADQNISADVVNAVMAVDTRGSLSDIDQRVSAVAEFSKLEAASSLVETNKRVANILSKNDIRFDAVQNIDTGLFSEDAERSLFSAYVTLKLALEEHKGVHNYQEILRSLSSLREPLAAYFDKVMIMAEDEKVKLNRIGLLSNVRGLFMSVADISLLNI